MSIQNFGEALPPVTSSATAKRSPSPSKPRRASVTRFRVIHVTGKDYWQISKEGDKLNRELFRAKTTRECWDYYYSELGYSELCARWEIVKSESAISESDIRTTKEVINTYPLYSWQDLSVERFHRIYPFRGVEFGEWVSPAEREDFLVKTFVAMGDLEMVIQQRLQVTSLGIAFGDRGAGRKAAAHFEPTNEIINLTRKKGQGCLAHEMFHWMDKNDQYSTQIMGYVPKSFMTRCHKLDRTRTKAYWSTKREVGARIFEQWVKDSLTHLGWRNDFLVNIVTPEKFSKSPEYYPYLLPEEKNFVYTFLDNKFRSYK